MAQRSDRDAALDAVSQALDGAFHRVAQTQFVREYIGGAARQHA